MGFLSLVSLPPSIAQVSLGSISGFLSTQNLCTHVQVHMCTYVCTYTHQCVYVCSCYSVNTDNHSIPPTCSLPEELSIHPHPPATRGPQWEKMATCFMTTRFHYHLLVAVKEVQSELLSVDVEASTRLNDPGWNPALWHGWVSPILQKACT